MQREIALPPVRTFHRFSSLLLAATAPAVLVACVSASQSRPAEAGTTRERVIRPQAATQPWRAQQQPVTRQQSLDPSFHRPAPGLVTEIADLWRAFPGKAGIAVRRIDSDWEISQRGAELFPQQSVSKMWVSLTILDQVDKGRVRLDEPLRIGRDDLAVFHQPIRERVMANGEIRETVRNLMEQAITKSDNTANDRLLWHAGGPQAIRGFIEDKGLGAIRFGPGERLLQSKIAGLSWNQSYAVGRRFYDARDAVPLTTRRTALNNYITDPMDGASPQALVRALARLARGELLSPASTRLMLDIMSRTSSGPNRLKGGAPAGWHVAHKTGTGQVLGSLATGYNDIGILTAPDGTRYAIAVMIGSTSAGIPERMRLMQNVSRAVARYHGQ